MSLTKIAKATAPSTLPPSFKYFTTRVSIAFLANIGTATAAAPTSQTLGIILLPANMVSPWARRAPPTRAPPLLLKPLLFLFCSAINAFLAALEASLFSSLVAKALTLYDFFISSRTSLKTWVLISMSFKADTISSQQSMPPPEPPAKFLFRSLEYLLSAWPKV